MQKTEQNLKVLEKRVRQLVHRMQDMKESKPAPSTFDDLPLLKGAGHLSSPELEKLRREREEVREGIRRLMERIEHYLE